MSSWRYFSAKLWLKLRHRKVRISRCSFHSAGKGWLVNLSVPINRIVAQYSKEDVVKLHGELSSIALSLATMLGPNDAIQWVTGEDATPKQFYKQWLKKNGTKIEVSERQTIHQS